MVQAEEKMNKHQRTAKMLERKTHKANEARDTASERFWKTWDLVATERQRVFLLHLNAMGGTLDASIRPLPVPVRRQEYRRLMKIHLRKEIEGTAPARKEPTNETAA